MGSKASAATLLNSPLDERRSTSSFVAGSEAVACVREALARLPESYGRVVAEVDISERPVAEVAAELNKSPGAVHMLRSRAHARLRELLGEPEKFFGDRA